MPEMAVAQQGFCDPASEFPEPDRCFSLVKSFMPCNDYVHV
jgi:hypothetical protein